MDWKDIIWPWGALREARKDLRVIIQEHANKLAKVKELEAELLPLKTRVAMQKVEINRLNGIIEKQPERLPNGRFRSKTKA